MKESCFLVTEFVETLDLNSQGWHEGLGTIFSRLGRFKTEKKIS